MLPVILIVPAMAATGVAEDATCQDLLKDSDIKIEVWLPSSSWNEDFVCRLP